MAKRTEYEIMSDIIDIFCELSPENLSNDGMLSIREVNKKEKELKQMQKLLFKELGREVSELEAFDFIESNKDLY